MERENFGSRFAVIMALAGSAIGLGNIWRFPYMVGENGGAAFIIMYIVASLVLSLPLFFAEFVIGRKSRANCIGAMKKLAPGSAWRWLGMLCIVTPMIIVSYYSVVGGWSLNFLWRSLVLEFSASNADGVTGVFGEFISSTWTPLAFFLLYLGIAGVIVATGVKKGIELFSKVSIPLLFVLVVLIALYSLSIPGAERGVEYLLKPDFSRITASMCVNALGQSFYSLSLGMGILITYSSYVSKEENAVVSGAGAAVSDLGFAVIAGFAIMPAVFAAGIEPGSGPGLVFQTIPYIFSTMGATMPVLSAVVAVLFFLTILVAALTSTVSLLEVGVAYLIEEKGFTRRRATVTVFCFAAVVGALCSLSFGPLAGVKIAGLPIFDALDKFSSNVLLAAGGFLCVVFVGWRMKREDVKEEFTNGGTLSFNNAIFGTVYFLMRWVAPVAIVAIVLSNILI